MKVRPSVEDTKLFPSRLREAMRRCGISQEELADRVGASQSSVSFWLLGDRFPRIPMLFKLADALNVNALWLLGNDTQSDSENVLDLYFGLDESDQAKAIGYMQALASSPKYDAKS